MPSTLKKQRYRLEFWIDENGKVEDDASAHPILTRPAAGALPAQEVSMSVTYMPSSALKALIKAEQKTAVDIEVGK